MYIIADMSCNFQELDDIMYVIETVRADYFKLQYYSEKDLYGDGSDFTKLNIEWMPYILEQCQKYGKKLLCTVFNPAKVRLIDPFVEAHKIASSEITDIDLLNEIKKCKKDVFLSTGGASKEEIIKANTILAGLNVTLLACDVEYPSRRHNIRNMLYLKYTFPSYNVGYSDHSIDIGSLPLLCNDYKAYVIEKHIKPNEDHHKYESHALTLDEFNEMARTLKLNYPLHCDNPHKRVYNEELKRWVRPRV